ncbi:MAG: thiamine pyrophosphate-dependent dehydrogenase E1 component subunit alpha [Acidobacteriia bacterium]|nr:thiamine pyrophosphate-dependent dehydrogenase E1 component subunit alpha [Terriglobia bacterium]
MAKKNKKNGHRPQKPAAKAQDLKDLNLTAYRAATVPVRAHNFGAPPSRDVAGRVSPGSQGDGTPRTNRYGIPDWRLEVPDFRLLQVEKDGEVKWEVEGKLDSPAPPIRESKYLTREQSIEIYRWMHLNRRMETALENLYKQGKVVGGVYFGLGQEACSCASAFALKKDEWLAPMIRNQGSMLVKGFAARDIMRQYMAKADSPTWGRDASSHFGDIYERNVVAPISMLGDLIPVMAGVALGARYQGRSIAVMTYIGDGGQSTGVFHEGLNFAAVQKLGLVLIVENNLWGYSTPNERQFAIKDLAERALAYGVPSLIIDGTDACQVYDAAHEACERARRGEGPTLIEAKMMRMKGHAIHDAAQYVPRPLFEYWQRRDPIARFENYLVKVKKWLSAEENKKVIEDVEKQLEADRDAAVASPMPDPATDAEHQGVYCDGKCHAIKPKYGLKQGAKAGAKLKATEAAGHLK